ncbi:MAG: hypothetical protein LUO79_07240 [Methanomassiliicoccales archaeon]|nr:hypothetical protein [Methanomassiliicoccales archaeon]
MSSETGCRVEIAPIDPEVYTVIVNHPLRKEILRALYLMARSGPVSKQVLAESLSIDYHQLVYQLNHHLRDFWTVVEERKIRGTRMELIAPSHPYTIYLALGKGKSINVFDPPANLFGTLSKVGTRCDSCSQAQQARCMTFVDSGCSCTASLSAAEKDMLKANGRVPPYKPLDKSILCALKGISSGEPCAVDIPCNECAFMKKTIAVKTE